MDLLGGFKKYLRDRHEEKVKEIKRLLDEDINRVSRKGDFYKTNNDFYTNAGILQTHKKSINAALRKQRAFLIKYCSIEEAEKLEAQLMQHAVLWDEFRNEGLKMAPDKLDELIRLEENSAGTDKGYELKLMISELQEKSKRVPLNERKVTNSKENLPQRNIDCAVR